MPDMEHAHAQFEFDIAAGCSQALGPSHHIIAKCLIAGDKDESRRQAGPPDRHKVEKRQRLASESRRASCSEPWTSLSPLAGNSLLRLPDIWNASAARNTVPSSQWRPISIMPTGSPADIAGIRRASSKFQ